MQSSDGRIRYRDGKGVIRYVADTPENRASYAGKILSPTDVKRGRAAGKARVSGAIQAQAKPGTEATAVAPAPTPAPIKSAAAGDAAASAAVTAELGQTAGASVTGVASAAPTVPQVSYEQVVKIINMIIRAQAPGYEMTADEESQIGVGLDAVIAKHWPSLQQAGPEFALAVAVLGYAARILIPLLAGKRQAQTELSLPAGAHNL